MANCRRDSGDCGDEWLPEELFNHGYAAEAANLGRSTEHLPSPLDGQGRLIPATNLARIMSTQLPHKGRISRDSRLLMQEVTTEILCFLSAEADSRCREAGRTTMRSADVILAMNSLDFEHEAVLVQRISKYFRSRQRQTANRFQEEVQPIRGMGV